MAPKLPKGRSIRCIGGPKDGIYQYPHPLPDTLVFQNPMLGFREEYYRKPDSCTYIHSDLLKRPEVREALGITGASKDA